MGIKNKKIYTPNKTTNIQITKRDLKILHNIFIFRLIRTDQLLRLLKNEISYRMIRNRLNLLFHNGYIDRIKEPYKRNTFIINAINNKSINLLFDKKIIRKKTKTDFSEKNKKISSIFLQHTLFVADVMSKIINWCNKKKDLKFIGKEELFKNFSAETKKQKNPFMWEVKYFDPASEKNIFYRLAPDDFFGIEYLRKDKKIDRDFFFLEIDRGTMPIKRKKKEFNYKTSYYKKMFIYFQTFKKNKHIENFNINNFRVITITTSLDRIYNMILANRLINKTGSRLFLFTSFENFLKTKKIENIVFINGKGEHVKLYKKI